MKRYNIPTEYQNSYYQKPVLVGLEEFRFEFIYNDRDDCHYLTLSLRGDALLTCVKLISGVNILNFGSSSNIPLNSDLYLYDLDRINHKLGRDSGWDVFGDRVNLVFEFLDA